MGDALRESTGRQKHYWKGSVIGWRSKKYNEFNKKKKKRDEGRWLATFYAI